MKRLEGKPFALIGVNTDENREMVKTRSKKDQVTWRSFFDPQGSRISRDWKVNGFPTLYVIDAKGVIRLETHSADAAEKQVDKLLAAMEKTPQ